MIKFMIWLIVLSLFGIGAGFFTVGKMILPAIVCWIGWGVSFYQAFKES